MKNLLKETIEELKNNGKTYKDVLWVGSKNGYSTWDDFEKVANIEYDNGYGGNEIAMDLWIVGKDFWLERHEYDGSEWWEFKSIPIKPKAKRKLKSVLNNNYDDKVEF
jgi:hypothetical protein